MGLADSLKRETGRAIRSLARSPGFTLIVIITLALGIGATTSIFAMLDRIVLHALPYADSDRLVWLDSPTPGIKPDSRWGLSAAGFFYFQKNAHAGFLEVEGHAEIVLDRQRIKDLWNFMLKTWFTEGEDDPRITAIRVTPRRGYYWDNKHGDAVAGAKVVVGAVIGKTLDDSIEGTLTF